MRSPETTSSYLQELENGITEYIKQKFRHQKHSAPDPISLFGSFKMTITYVVCRTMQPDIVG